ncbi:hypothetical protein HOLleu_10989 [Holothuria leucospilota]|uniref:Uncharacterized protein n=1 Tax=Holothuria leucospilota TaxID=206669 RepID=A0A9Q1CFM3_HOLLE|nr:hypothetical protein HOLleu_10989 [Holothuria leucospilota]
MPDSQCAVCVNIQNPKEELILLLYGMSRRRNRDMSKSFLCWLLDPCSLETNHYQEKAVTKQTKDMIEVKFMQRADKEGCSFIWPSGAKGEQLYTHPEKDVLHVLRATSVSMKGRAVQ